MATAQEIINDAATMAGVLADGQSLNSSMNSSILRALNRLLESWDFLAVPELDYADTIRLPSVDLRAILLNLVVDLFMVYQRPQRPDVYDAARRAYVEMLGRYADNEELEIPVEVQSTTNASILTDE